MVYVSRELRTLVLSFMNMVKISSASFEDKVDPLYREVEKDRVHMNFIRIVPSSIGLLLVQLCGIVFNVITRADWLHRWIYILSFCVFFTFSAVVLIFINHTLASEDIRDKKKKTIYILYWVVYMLCALSFGIFEMMDTGTTNHYFIFVLAFSVWPMLTPEATIPFYMFGIAVETVALLIHNGDYLDYVFCFLITALGLIASYVKFSSYMSNKILKKQLEQMAEIDQMTGLLNRRGMQHSVDVIWGYCRRHDIPVTVAMLDIDFFKMYNDTFGHAKGDDCIKAIADCIKQSFGRRTDIAARYGGEEFILIVSGETDRQMAMSLLKLQNRIEELGIKSGNLQFNNCVTVSIGAWHTTIDDRLTFKDVLQLADRELYNAKNNGRKCLSFKGELYNAPEE